MSNVKISLEALAEQHMLRPMRSAFKIQKNELEKFQVTIDDDQLAIMFQGIFKFFILTFDRLESEQSELALDSPILNAVRLLNAKFKQLARPPTATELQNLNSVASQLAYILEMVLNEGIGIPPSLRLSGIDTAELIQLSKSSGSLLGAYDILLRREEPFNRLLQNWQASDSLRDRYPILEKALKAHKTDDYALSIPIFLIHIESLFNSINVRKKDGTKHYSKKQIVRNSLASSLQSSSPNMNYFLRDSFMSIVVDEILRSDHEVPTNLLRNFPNRHEVLHGKDLNYFKDPLNSTRCLVVLDGLTGIDFRQFDS